MAPAVASSFVEQLQSLAETPPDIATLDRDTRVKILDATRKLNAAMEVPGDTVHRIANTPLQLATARIGVMLGLWKVLSEGSSRMSAASLAEVTGADPIFMSRLLRYYASFDMVKEVGEDQFVANNITKALGGPSGIAGINYFCETIQGCFTTFPKFMKDTGFKNPEDPTHCPWQLSHGPGSPFEWLSKNPEHMDYFLPWMTLQREGLPTWLDVFPLQTLIGSASAEKVFFVDVGGAMGHQCMALKARHPSIPGKIILQDLPQVIAQTPPMAGIEAMSYDFFTPEPIQGARAYYMRNILHDWPDVKCLEIIKNVKSAMAKDSVLLIDEMVMPATKANWRATQLDLAMLTCLTALERSEKQWYALMELAEMKIDKIYRYTEELYDCIIAVVPK